MSVGPLGMVGSSAGSPLAQSQGSDVNRAQQDTASQSRQTQMSEKAEHASGVGQTEQDEEATDRDADGRRPWEIGLSAAGGPVGRGRLRTSCSARARILPSSPGASSTSVVDVFHGDSPLPCPPAAG